LQVSTYFTGLRGRNTNPVSGCRNIEQGRQFVHNDVNEADIRETEDMKQGELL
jgi:hypothetical protein